MRNRISSFLADRTLKARAVRSTFFSVLSLGGQNFIRLASNLVLTRILFPEAFGLMALVQVIVAGLKLFSDFGVREAAVQSEDGGSAAFLNTAWVINIARGVILWVATLLLAAPMADFYDAPQLEYILPVVGLTLIFSGLTSPRTLFADRNLMIGRLTILYLGCQIFSVLVMIVLAWWLQSVWALAIGWLTQSIVLAALSHLVLPGERARFSFDPVIARRILGFGKHIFFATTAAFVISQADRAILGKFVSLDKLAIYNIGLTLAMVPVMLSQALSSRILFPIYARKPPSEGPETRRKINLARRLLTGGALLGSGILGVSGVALIGFLYDTRYAGAGPVVVLISLSMIPIIITYSYHRLPLAAGHSGRFAILSIAIAIIQLLALILGIQSFGLGGAAIAPGIAALLTYPALVVLAKLYSGWDPVHDAAYFTAGLFITATAFWMNGDGLRALFMPL